jgi:DNA-binding MarR family transcriptional regulator
MTGTEVLAAAGKVASIGLDLIKKIKSPVLRWALIVLGLGFGFYLFAKNYDNGRLWASISPVLEEFRKIALRPVKLALVVLILLVASLAVLIVAVGVSWLRSHYWPLLTEEEKTILKALAESGTTIAEVLVVHFQDGIKNERLVMHLDRLTDYRLIESTFHRASRTTYISLTKKGRERAHRLGFM